MNKSKTYYGLVVKNQHGGQSFTDFYTEKKKAQELAEETISGLKKYASDSYFKVSLIEAEHIAGTTFTIDADDISQAKTVFENVVSEN
jgi:hypothetical protein